jgi:hypothetical protein
MKSMITMKFFLLILAAVSMLLPGCGDSSSQSFETLVTDAESRLQQLNTSDTHSKNRYVNFRSTVDGNTGTLSFTYEMELDASSLGGGIIETSFDWRATYQFTGGAWNYVSSERQVHHLSGAVVWETPRTDAEGNAAVLTILESLQR